MVCDYITWVKTTEIRIWYARNSDNTEAMLFLLSYVNVELNCVDESMR